MDVLNQIEAVRLRIARARQAGQQIVLVPTMGALHRGHLALVERARQTPAALIVVSIFVNPTQFGPGEDLEAYPRTLKADCAACEAVGVDLIFAPTADTIYETDTSTVVHVEGLTDTLCGPHRPGHFDGVATIVTKLLNIVQPDRAIFGEKDYQQLQVIRRMTRDLNLPVEIEGAPTVRESDGLALSSRNAYLSTTQRRQATSLFQALSYAAERVQAGDQDAPKIINAMRRILHDAGPVSIDYVQIVDPETLEDVTLIDRPAQAAIAARIGQTRLIDNQRLDPPQKSA